MSLASQAIQAVQLARTRHPSNPGVQAAADSVEAALAPAGMRDAQVGEPYSACVTVTRADASLFDRVITYRLAGCEAWLARLRAVLPSLSAALRAAGDEEAAETVDAVGDAARNQGIITNEITPPLDAASWWDTLPRPVQIGIGVAGVWLVLDVLSKVGNARGAFR